MDLRKILEMMIDGKENEAKILLNKILIKKAENVNEEIPDATDTEKQIFAHAILGTLN